MGAAVASVGDVPIFAAEVAAQATLTGKTPRAALQELIAFHSLAAAARDRGLTANAPEHLRAVDQALVERLLERDFEPRVRREEVPEAELRAGYERAKRTFVHPRLVEIMVLAVYTGARMRPEPRERARRTAADLDRHIRTRPARTAEDFETVATDPTWLSRGVKRFRVFQSHDEPFPAKVGAEAQKLKRPGDTTPLVEDETGLYIARYVSERPAQNRSFEEVRGELLEGYYPRWRQQRFLQFAAEISERQRARVLSAPAEPRR